MTGWVSKMHNGAERFDTVIIGGGLAGLSCAALLTKAGCKVVLLEKNRRIGGYAVSYTLKKHRFDIAIQAIGGCDPKGAIYRLLQDIHREESVQFLPCEPARVYYFNDSDEPWLQPGSCSTLIETLCRRFPDYCRIIEECYRIWSGILTELERIASPETRSAAFGFARSYPLLAQYGGYTVKDFLDEQGVPEEIQTVLVARSGYCMLPPDRLSLVGFSCTEMTYSKGAWLVKGGMDQLTQTLVKSIQDQGGMVEHNSRVSTILTERGKVRGVVTQDGRFYPSHNVVVASAVQTALGHWLDTPDLIPDRYSRKVAAMEATGSYYVAYYSVGAEVVEGLWPNIEIRNNNKSISGLWSPEAYYILIPSLIDSTAAPPGFHCLCLSVPCPAGYDILGVEGRRCCRTFLEREVEKRFPQLKGKMTFLFELAPEQLASISGNPGGSAYGWAQTPEQSGIKRLNLKTPIPGLYLAGHWTMPGGGIAGVVTSGQLCAQAILAEGTQ